MRPCYQDERPRLAVSVFSELEVRIAERRLLMAPIPPGNMTHCTPHSSGTADAAAPVQGGGHAFGFLHPRVRDGVTIHSRRSVLKASLAGIGGLTLPGLLR